MKKDGENGKRKTVELDSTNEEFAAVRQLLEETDQSVFLTGKAGTGKSTFLRHLTATTKKKYVVLAPTGIAAVNVGGQTLHSFFKIPLKPLLPIDPEFAVSRLRSRLKYSKQTIKLIKSLQLIIVDEISMVRADTIDFIDRVLRVFSGNMKQPFGGKQMLFVGDVFQLEPVVTGNDRDILSHCYSSFFFFNAHVFKEINLVPIELTKVYRQDDETFVRLLDKIRKGHPTQACIDLLNTRYNPKASHDNLSKDFMVNIATRRDIVDSINERHLNALTTPLVKYEGLIENEFPLTALPTDMTLELKVGAQVVFIKNDPEKRWVNGTIAVVDTCLPDQIVVRTEDGEEHEVSVEKWSNVKYVYNEKTHKVDEVELGAFYQYPLKPAWALTIHKSQGLTFNKVIIDIGSGAFTGGQTYVALSRCRSLEGISLVHRISMRDIYVKPEIIKFAETFNSKTLIQSAIESSRADMFFKSASRRLDKGQLHEAFEAFVDGVGLKPDVLRRPDIRRLLRIKSLMFLKQERRIKQLEDRIAENERRFSEIAGRYVALADELAGGGWETEAAIAQYDKALEISPDFPPAILGKARMLLKSGLVDEAFNFFNIFANSEAGNAWEGNIGMAEICLSENDELNALNQLVKAHERFPNESVPLERLVSFYQNLQDFETANIYKRKLYNLKKKRK